MTGEAAARDAHALFAQGVRQFQAGQLAEADRSFEASLALARAAATLVNLAVVRLKLARPADTLALADEVLAHDAGHRQALGLRALALAELARRPEALAAFDRALAAEPDAGHLWMQRGTLLGEMGRFDAAAQSYRQALANGGDPQLCGYYLAAVAGGEPPRRAPRDYVEGLFDKYADTFDVDLVQQLHYQVPKVLAERLAQLQRRFASVLDLGCGTGLCGRIAKSIMLRIEGVDLSQRMLQKAGESGAYERLVQADIGEFLRSAPGPYDLVIAADVFVYVGAFDEVFREVARVLQPAGVFCFSVEDADGAGELVLRESRRYAHSEHYVRELAARCGFTVVDMQRARLRDSSSGPVAGIYFWLARSA